MNVTKRPEVARLNLRLPADLKDWIAQQAAIHFHSANAEFVRILEAARSQQSGESAASRS